MAKAENNLTSSNNLTEIGVNALKGLLSTTLIKKQIKSLLGDKMGHFMMAIVQIVEGSPQLQQADPQSIINAAIISAILDLPLDKNLGFCYIVPYKDGKQEIYKAQFQIGYKGYIQLALRTGSYKFINAIEVRKGELKSYNLLTGEFDLEFIEDIDKRLDSEIIGYASYIEFTNGFRNTLYMTKNQVEKHAKKYSQAYQVDLNRGWKSSNWSKNFDAMALKTVLKLNLSKYGSLSIDVQKALQLDGAAINQIEEDGAINATYIENTGDEIVIIDNTPATDEDRTDLLKLATPLNINLVEVVKKELKIDFDKMSKSQSKEIEAYIANKLEAMM